MMFTHYYRPPATRQRGQGLGSLFKMALPWVKGGLKATAKVVGRQAVKHGPRLIKKGSKIAYRTLKSKNKKATAKRELERAVAKEVTRAIISKPPRKGRPYKGPARSKSRRKDIFD